MKLPIAIAGAAVAAVLSMTLPAAAANFVTTNAVNMRVGPAASYPRITTIPAHAGVTVHGCVRNFTWCDTTWRQWRGWVSARYLRAIDRGVEYYLPDYGPRFGIPIITFHFGNYWDRHYHNRPWYRDQHWYRDRDRWDRNPPRFREPPRMERPPKVVRPPKQVQPPKVRPPKVRPRAEAPRFEGPRFDGPRADGPRFDKPRVRKQTEGWAFREGRRNDGEGRKIVRRRGDAQEEEFWRRRGR